ncbi:MAG: DNA-binding domain-containing protein [Kofleriaceae bacterium]
MRDLAAIQRRFYELVTAGEGAIDPGLLGSSRRLDVYAEMYLLRLVDALVGDYPKLRAAVGDEAFRALAAEYVRARPPRSFTLRDAGDALADYLESRPGPWMADLARLERARVEVFDGPDSVALTRDDLACVALEQFPDVELRFVRSSALVHVRWAVDELWSSVEDDVEHVVPAKCSRSILVWRRDLQVLHRTLAADEARLAQMLASGASITALSAQLAELGADDPDRRIVELLTRWLDAAVLRSGAIPPHSC